MSKSNKSNRTNIAASGFLFEAQRETAITDIKRAIHEEGQDVKQVRLDFMAGLIAYRLFPTAKLSEALAKGKGIAGATSAGHEPKAGQAVRTPEQETAFEAAKRQWSRLGRDAGVIKPRAKSKAPRKGDGKPKADKPKASAPAKPKSAAAANMALLNMAQSASGYCSKHKSVVSAEASHAVADFLAAMAKLAK